MVRRDIEFLFAHGDLETIEHSTNDELIERFDIFYRCRKYFPDYSLLESTKQTY